MNVTTAAIAAALAGLSLGLASPALAENADAAQPLADPNALGTYTFEAESGEKGMWTVTPCADDSVHCVHVASSGGDTRAPWSADAHWVVGDWILFVDQADAILCNSGGSAPGRNNYSWDATDLNGYIGIYNAKGACGSEPSSLAIPFTLTKTGGPPRPPEAPIYNEPYVVQIPEPYVPPAGQEAGGPMAAEASPEIVATPNPIPNLSEPLTEAIVAEPGFNAEPGGGARR